MKTIQLGSKGDAVRLCQERLVAKGYSLGVDGAFGPNTCRRVEQFQAAQNLTVDGVVGDKTWDALMSTGRVATPEALLQEERDDLLEKAEAQLKQAWGHPQALLEKVLALAVRDLGAKEEPDGSNDGPGIHHLVKGCNKYWWVVKPGITVDPKTGPSDDQLAKAPAWCGMTVANWIREALDLPYWALDKGYAPVLPGHPFERFLAGVASIEEWADRTGYPKWLPMVMGTLGRPPLPGDLFTMGRGSSGSDPAKSSEAGHVGMVVADDGDYVITIEGNISNSVGTRRRKKVDLRWFIRWWK